MSDTFEPGSSFGSYRLERRLGGGGFGSVWRARDGRNGATVALKVLTGRYASGDAARIRSEVEVLAAAASRESPHVVRVLGGGAEPAPHVVMEFIDGTNLEEELETRGALPQAETVHILHAVAEALATLERAGIIHRDVKPANIMLTREREVKLTDFGMAKIAGFESVTATGQLPLSAAYAAPEVWSGEATHQSDLYALGSVAFQCLAGARPFTGTFVQLYEAHRNRDPELGLLPGETVPALRQLITACLAKDPARRPTSAADVVALLDQAAAELSAARPVSAHVPDHEPQALGPWLIQSHHPSQPWAFLCRHETTGERATVEVHSGDSLEVGAGLRGAVAANEELVALGAERLLGTNRLILRPGEAWHDPPPGAFQFWVARQELPGPRPAETVSPALLAEAGRAASALESAAGRHDIRLSFASASLSADGDIYLRRPWLPSPGAVAALDWLASLPLDADARKALEGAASVESLVEALTVASPLSAFGVAQVADGTTLVRGAAETESQLYQPPTVVVAEPVAPGPVPATVPPVEPLGPDKPLVTH